MMKTKNLVIVVMVVVVLAALSFWQKSNHQESTSRSATEVLIEGPLTLENTGRITLGLGSEEEIVSLRKNPDQSWAVSSAWNAPGDAEKISNLLFNLNGLKGEYRSDNAAVLKDYKLDKDQAVSVRGYGNDGTLAFEIFVGVTPAGSQGSFVRLPSGDRVHLTQKNLLAPLSMYGGPALPANKSFINLKLLATDQSMVNGIVLEDEGQTLELVKVFAEAERAEGQDPAISTVDRSTWEWKLAQESGVALAKTKVDAVMNALLGIRAIDVDDPTTGTEAYGLQTASRKATLFFEDGTSQTLVFGAERPADVGIDLSGNPASTLPAGRWLHVGDSDAVWITTDYTVNSIFKKVDDLKAE